LIATVLVLFLLFLALGIARLAGNDELRDAIRKAIRSIFTSNAPA
jgi:hypothetical protein